MRFLILVFMCVVAGTASGRAAENTDAVTTPSFTGYTPVTIKSLIDLYWKTGLLTLDNKQALTEYIQVSACDVYHKTYHDDFAWPVTLEKTAAYLKTYQKNFGTRFVVVQPIALSRYLPDKGHFEITKETQYQNVRRLEFANFIGARAPCDGTTPPHAASLNAFVTFDRSITIDKIEMSADAARAAIAAIDSRKKASAEINNQNYRRFAYVRFYFTVNGFDRVKNDTDLKSLLMGPSLSFRGTLDGYEIFADLKGTTRLTEWRPDVSPVQ
jgi:hypothetical protein